MGKAIAPKEAAKCGMYVFRRSVFLEKSEKAEIKIFAAVRYILYINGRYICEGPCRGSADVRYYDSIVSDAFLKGNNEISVEVMHLTDPAEFSSVFKTNRPILVFSAKFQNKIIESDSSWKCTFRKGHKLVYFDWKFIPPNEEIQIPVQEALSETEEIFDLKDSVPNHVGAFFTTPFRERPIPMIYPQKEETFRIVKKGKNFVELDAGLYVTAKLKVNVRKNSDVKILYAECYEKEDGKKIRDDQSGFLRGAYDMIHTKEEAYTFQTFWFRAFRFVRIEAQEIDQAIERVGFMRCGYPLKEEGKFECSESAFNEMQTVSIHTLKCCMHEIFMDCPYYEQQQYLMDSAIESAALMRLSSDTGLIRKCIKEFAFPQREDGLLPANYPCSFTQVIPGFSFFWIFLLKDYLEYTKDVNFVFGHIGTMDRILSGFDAVVKKKGFITKSIYWDFVDWVPGWDYGVPVIGSTEALTIYNLYYAYALTCAEFIALKIGRKELSEEYKRRFQDIQTVLYRNCYDVKEELFKDGSETATYSMHTVIWAILSETVTGEQAQRMVEKMMDRIGKGSLSKSSFSMNYYLFRALEKAGKYEYAACFMEDWKKMLLLHCTTWCENPDQPRSECHGWSTAPLYEFSANVLGVKYSFEDEIQIVPQNPGNLTYAKGVVPTRFGPVKVSWRVIDKQFIISILSPYGVRKKILLPDREEHVFWEEEKTFAIAINR